MCELHFYKCPCGTRWTEAQRLSSCDDLATDSDHPSNTYGDPADTAGGEAGEGVNAATRRCPDSLCMHVGNPRKPQKKECEPCRQVREMLESMEDEQDGDAGGVVGGYGMC